MEENKEKNKGRNKGYDNLIPCKPGETANPNGRPKGQRNFATIYREAIKKLAEKSGTTPEEYEEEMIAMGVALSNKGKYLFYKDTLDRLHGTATNKTDITTGGDKIVLQISEAIAKKNDIKSSPEQNS